MKQKIDYNRIVLLPVGLAVGAWVLVFTWGSQIASYDALRMLASVLAILAGFLIASLVMLGDPLALYGHRWEVASAHRRQVRRALMRFVLLFYAYLGAIGVAFMATLLAKRLPVSVAGNLESVALALGAAALVWSFGLPWAIYSVQVGRLDEEVEKRRQDNRQEELDALRRPEGE